MDQDTPLFATALLVEDEPAHVLLIERALKGLIGTVVTCGTVRAAEAALGGHSYDVIVSDLNLPDMRSDAVVAALRGVAPKVPVLVLTSSATVADGVAAMRAGANDFLVKNFDATFRDVLQLSLARLLASVKSEREREALTRDRDLLREAIENSNDGLAVLSADGYVRHTNSSFQAFLKSFGVVNGNILSISPSLLLRGEEVLATLRERFLVGEPGAVWTTEMVRAQKEGGAFDVSVSSARGSLQGAAFVVWVRDIRERKKREQFQREILSTTTHDLKGPLGAISVSCDVLLEKERSDDRTNALLERIASSANSAIHLIEEFLSLRRIEEGTFVLRPIAHDVLHTMKKASEQYQLSAKTRSLELVVELGSEEVVGCVDPLGLERVLSNLISNAIKFTSSGGVIHVGARRVNDGVVVSVRDSGTGMEPADAQRLFARYARLPQHEAVSGTGLGLYIVKCIVSAHGGLIDVTSSVGRGTNFHLFFPDEPPRNERGEVMCLDFA